MHDIERKIREETSAMLFSRTRVVAGTVAVCILIGEISDFLFGDYFGRAHHRVVSVGGLLLMLGLAFATLHPSRYAPPRLVALGGIVALHSYMFALTFDAGPHAETVAVLAHALIALGAAILLPWGVWIQLIVAAVAACILHANLTLLPGEVVLSDTSLGIAVTNGLWLSVFIAYVIERSRVALSRKRHQYAEQKEIAEQQRIEAEALAEDLDAYAGAVAHDLRNPVTVIAGYSDLLRDEGDRLSDDGRSYLDAIGAGCDKLAQIISELLLLANVRRNTDVTIETLDMGAIIAEVLRRQSIEIGRTDAEVVLPDSWPAACGHAAWIEEVWANYISNAIKYGGTPPKIELGADPIGGDTMHFWVRDNGAGLTDEQIAKLFREFSRADPHKATGHGLGLSIVKRIVERLFGEVRVTSSVGSGSTFGFTLPATLGTAGNATTHEASDSSPNQAA